MHQIGLLEISWLWNSYSNTSSPPLLTFKIPKPNEIKDVNFCQESSRQPTGKKGDATTHPRKKTNIHKISQISFILMSLFFSSHHRISNTPKPKRLQIVKLWSFWHIIVHQVTIYICHGLWPWHDCLSDEKRPYT